METTSARDAEMIIDMFTMNVSIIVIMMMVFISGVIKIITEFRKPVICVLSLNNHFQYYTGIIYKPKI